MPIQRLALCLGIVMSILIPSRASSHVLESFTVYTQNVEVRQLTESSIQLKANNHAYAVKLEPNREGWVIFSLSGIGYATTARFSNLRFDVRITGYREDAVVYPSFSFDDVNKDITVEQNRLIFERIYGSLPVWFNEQVDSIHLQFSNSLGVNMDQYLGIQDLKIVSALDIASNPKVIPCQQQKVMIAIDGSSSIDKDERGIIAEQLLEFVRRSGFTRDSHTISILEYGSDLLAKVESTERRVLVDVLQKYKQGKNHKTKFIKWTNWSVALDEALENKPNALIFITDGWSNFSGGQARSFSAQYEDLMMKCNQLKRQGTRLLFITSDMDAQQNTRTILSSFLNNDATREIQGEMVSMDIDLGDVDLITMRGFAGMRGLNLSSLIACPWEVKEMLEQGMYEMISLK